MPDPDAGDRAVCGVDRVDDVVVAPGQPQQLSVDADIAHVGAAAARYRPVGDDGAGLEVHYRDAARAVAPAAHTMRAAVGDVEFGAVATRIEAVGADPGRDEADLGKALAIHHEDAVGHHVGDKKH